MTCNQWSHYEAKTTQTTQQPSLETMTHNCVILCVCGCGPLSDDGILGLCNFPCPGSVVMCVCVFVGKSTFRGNR